MHAEFGTQYSLISRPPMPLRAFICWRSPAGRPAISIVPIAFSCPRTRSTRTKSTACPAATLEAYIRQLLESHRAPQVTVAWQGGEPTLMKVEFFRRSVELVEKYRRAGSGRAAHLSDQRHPFG